MSAEPAAAKPTRYLIIAELKLTSIPALEQAIRNIGNTCAVAESSWIVASTHPLGTIHNLLRPVVRPADQLLIVDTDHSKATWTGYGPSDEAKLRLMWSP
jgi:hypothetical protein